MSLRCRARSRVETRRGEDVRASRGASQLLGELLGSEVADGGQEQAQSTCLVAAALGALRPSDARLGGAHEPPELNWVLDLKRVRTVIEHEAPVILREDLRR